MPTKWMKAPLSSTLSIITKNTFHGLPNVTKYVWFKPKIGTLFNFCQLLCTFLRYLYSRLPSVMTFAHVTQGREQMSPNSRSCGVAQIQTYMWVDDYIFLRGATHAQFFEKGTRCWNTRRWPTQGRGVEYEKKITIRTFCLPDIRPVTRKREPSVTHF